LTVFNLAFVPILTCRGIIKECEQSGLPVKEWCEINGVARKTYYYRLKRVREELLEAMDAGNTIHPSMLAGSAMISAAMPSEEVGRPCRNKPKDIDKPVFAALPVPQNTGAALTVWMGRYSVDIQNGADDAVVAQVLKVVAGL